MEFYILLYLIIGSANFVAIRTVERRIPRQSFFLDFVFGWLLWFWFVFVMLFGKLYKED